jgi:hypothetical protein
MQFSGLFIKRTKLITQKKQIPVQPVGIKTD